MPTGNVGDYRLKVLCSEVHLRWGNSANSMNLTQLLLLVYFCILLNLVIIICSLQQICIIWKTENIITLFLITNLLDGDCKFYLHL